MKTITLGVLLPSSTIFPISKEFEKGLIAGLKTGKENDFEFEIIKEFVGQGHYKQLDVACDKLFSYDDVDLITGLASNLACRDLTERFRARRKPLLINNLGEHLPINESQNEYVFTNSLFLWQHAWALGNWGVERFGKKGMFVGAIYDAGYSFSQMFYLGMKAADENSEWYFSVPPINEETKLSSIEVVFQYLEEYQPDFVFAAFCGSETTMFLNRFIEQGWHKRTQLLGLPYLLSPFSPLADDLTIYTTMPFVNQPEISADRAFHELGLKSGKAIAKAAASGDDLKEAFTALDDLSCLSGAGSIGSDRVAIVENVIRADQKSFSSKVIDIRNTEHVKYREGSAESDSSALSWYNPYLSI